MIIDQYSKIATTISTHLNGIDNPVVVMTSSNPEIDVLRYTNGVCEALHQQKKSVLLVDARLGESTSAKKGAIANQNGIQTIKLTPCTDHDNYVNDTFVEELLNEVKVGFEIVLVCTDSINQSTSTMFFGAQSNGVVLCEKKKSSRTDHIDEAIATIKNLNATALGFILE